MKISTRTYSLKRITDDCRCCLRYCARRRSTSVSFKYMSIGDEISSNYDSRYIETLWDKVVFLKQLPDLSGINIKSSLTLDEISNYVTNDYEYY